MLLPPSLFSSVGSGSGVDPPSGTGVRVGIVIWPNASRGTDKAAVASKKIRTQTTANKFLRLNINRTPHGHDAEHNISRKSIACVSNLILQAILLPLYMEYIAKKN